MITGPDVIGLHTTQFSRQGKESEKSKERQLTKHPERNNNTNIWGYVQETSSERGNEPI